jgi:hypothetical protein
MASGILGYGRERASSIIDCARIDDVGICDALIHRADEVACLPSLTEAQRVYAESISERLGAHLRVIQAAVASDESYEYLTTSMDLLREEIKIANATLDLLLTPASGIPSM